MTSESRTTTYGGLLPLERSALPMASTSLPRFAWPRQWQARRMRCLHCRVLLFPATTPTPTEPIVTVTCWSCGRTLCELVSDSFRAMTRAEFAALPIQQQPCCGCGEQPATRRERLCDPCMEARQLAGRMRHQHDYQTRKRERLTQQQRDAINAGRRQRYRERVGLT